MKIFDTIAELALAKLQNGQFVSTGGNTTKGDGGGETYLVSATGTAQGDITLANANVAVLQRSRFTRKFLTLADAIAANELQEGDSADLSERTTGNDGGAFWDVVLLSTVTPDTYTIVASTGVSVGAGALALVLRHEGEVSISQMGFAPGDNITPGVISFMANTSIKFLTIDGKDYNIDETWPHFVTNGKVITGISSLTILTYVGVAGADANNMVEVIKLSTAARTPISRGSLTNIRLDLNNIDFVRGVSIVYFTNESTVGNIVVLNVASGSEGIVLDKLWYGRWGKLSVRNNPAAQVGKGIVFRGTVDSLSSINSIILNQVTLIGLSDNILFDTTTAAINTVTINGNSEAGINGVTHVGVLGVTEANINLHMEGNTRNVRWEGTASAGAGLISWGGVWNNTAGGAIKLGNSDHNINVRLVGTMDLFKWGPARARLLSGAVSDQGGTGGTEDIGAVTYTFLEEVTSFPGWLTSQQAFVNVTTGNWIKGASDNLLTTTTGFVEFDFTSDITVVSGYSIVGITVAALRPDGSRKTFTGIGYKRPTDTVNYLIESIGGDVLDASFEVELTVAGTLRVKTAINENIMYSGRVDPQ